jgi:ABC-2 type transport system permease protein
VDEQMNHLRISPFGVFERAGDGGSRPSFADPVRRFVENAVIVFQALFRWFNPSAYVATKIIMPVEQLLAFGLLARYAGGQGKVSYLVIGNAIALAGLGGFSAAGTVGEERSQATLPMLIASPANRLLNFLERGLVHILDALVSVAVALVFAVTVFHVDFGSLNPGAFAAAVLVATVSSIALGLFLGAVAIAWSEFFLVTNLLYLVVLVLAGVNFPVSALPAWIQPLSYALPFTRSIESARHALHGASLTAVAPPLLGELGLAVAYLVLGYSFLRRMETLAIRRGTLEMT